MGLVVHITTGSRAGQRETLARAVSIAGRHPECDLRFDAQVDLDVSTRHAEFRSEQGGWIVRDLGSTNGTFVNGSRIASPTPVKAGDVVLLGSKGPRIEIVSAGASSEAAVPRTAMRESASVARASTQERIAIAVAGETSSLKRFVIGLAAIVVIGVGVLVWMNQRTAAQSRDTITALLARSDSLSEALQRTAANASGREAGLDSLVRVLQRERAQLARQLQAGDGNVGQITTQLDALDRRTNQALSIGGADYRDIAAANTKAVAFLAVEEQSGDAYSGTAFSITSGGLLVTNQHVLRDTAGNLPRRLGVWFSGDTVFRPARVVRTGGEHDLALIQIIEPGTYPTVRGLVPSNAVAAGDLVAVIGFPLGTTLTRGRAKLATLAGGMVSKIERDTIAIDAYAAQGSSGSPVFDARGNVIGVLFGSPTESGGRIMYVVPSSALISLLEGSERAIVR